MAARPRIGLRQIRSLGAAQTLWDSSLPGFGTRRQNGSAVAYILKYRTAEGRQRWFTIGRHGAPWTPETARAEAKRLLGDIARRMDPAAPPWDLASSAHFRRITSFQRTPNSV